MIARLWRAIRRAALRVDLKLKPQTTAEVVPAQYLRAEFVAALPAQSVAHDR